MVNYKIKVNIEIIESADAVDATPQALADGKYEFNISGTAAESIDECEQALLSTSYPALRAALANHLETVSKKNLRSKRPKGFGS